MGECILIFFVKFKMVVFGLSASNGSHVLKIREGMFFLGGGGRAGASERRVISESEH